MFELTVILILVDVSCELVRTMARYESKRLASDFEQLLNRLQLDICQLFMWIWANNEQI